jgi:sulfur-oxidizing protein SoxY
MLNLIRRSFVLSGLVVFSTLLTGKMSFAAINRKLFDAPSVAEALNTLPEKLAPEPSNRLMINAPEISANPQRIQIHLRSELPGTDLFLLMASSSTPPMIAQFTIPVGTEADVRTEIKLADTTKLLLVVRAAGKLYSVQKEVKIAKPLDTATMSQ